MPLRLDAEMRSSKARLCGRADPERDQGLALPDCEWAKRRGWSLINGEVNRSLAVAPIERRKQPFRTARLGRLRSAAVQVCSDGVCFKTRRVTISRTCRLAERVASRPPTVAAHFGGLPRNGTTSARERNDGTREGDRIRRDWLSRPPRRPNISSKGQIRFAPGP